MEHIKNILMKGRAVVNIQDAFLLLYKSLWAAVEYDVNEGYIAFKAKRLNSFNDENDDVSYLTKEGKVVKDFNDGEVECLISGTVKLDGNCHWNFGEESGYVNFSSWLQIVNFNDLLIEIHTQCGNYLKGSGQEVKERMFAALELSEDEVQQLTDEKRREEAEQADRAEVAEE